MPDPVAWFSLWPVYLIERREDSRATPGRGASTSVDAVVRARRRFRPNGSGLRTTGVPESFLDGMLERLVDSILAASLVEDPDFQAADADRERPPVKGTGHRSYAAPNSSVGAVHDVMSKAHRVVTARCDLDVEQLRHLSFERERFGATLRS